MKKIFFIPLLLVGCDTMPPQKNYVSITTTSNVTISSVTPAAPSAAGGFRQITRVTDDPSVELMPRVSPDGLSMLFTTIDGSAIGSSSYSISRINLGKLGRSLIAGPGAASPSWSPNGNEIYFVNLKSGSPAIVKKSINGVGFQYVGTSSFGAQDGQPSVSQIGGKIAFHTKLNGGFTICTIDSDGKNFTSYVEGRSPRWSPDGRKILFERSVGSLYQIFILDISKGDVTQITSGDYSSQHPSWSPDGHKIVFSSDREGKNHIFVLSLDTGDLRQLTQGETQEFFPDWSKDGYIYFSSDAGAKTPQSSNPYEWLISDIWKVKVD